MAEKERWVDTDVSGGTGDGTSRVNAYATLSIMENAEDNDGDLAGDGDNLLVNFVGVTAADPGGFLITGFTTGSGSDIKIITPDDTERHQGVWSTSYTRIDDTSGTAIYVLEEYVTLEGMQIYSHDDNLMKNTASGAGEFNMSHCILRHHGGGGSNEHAVLISGPGNSSNGVANIWNCLIYDSPDQYYACILLDEANCTINIENVTIANSYTAFRMSGADQENIRNCQIDATDVFYGTFTDNDANNDYNYSSENTNDGALGSHGAYNQTFDYVAGGYTKDENCPTIDQGEDGTSGNIGFTGDIIGEARGTWDIGAFEYPEAVGGVAPTGNLAGPLYGPLGGAI